MPGSTSSTTSTTSTSSSIANNTRRLLTPYIYTPSASKWTPLPAAIHHTAVPLPRSTTLRILSWNIDMSFSSQSIRTTTALTHLCTLFQTPSPSAAPFPPTILMFQEMTRSSLSAILAHPWIRSSFVISNIVPPSAAHYFTLLLVSRDLRTGGWLRVNFEMLSLSSMGRDVLAVDVLLADGNPPSGGDGEGGDGALNANEEGKKRSCIRIATTHLESLGEEPGFEVRPLQLALIARLLKERPSETEEGEGRSDVEIVGGLVGGDMNAISEVDFTSHKRADVELRDAWEEAIGAETVRGGEESEDGSKEEEDANVGSAEGHTWGYQNRSKWPPRRLDKFFVTGGVQVVKLEETKGDCSGNIGRVGVGMKIESGLWISDHFGIAVGIKVL